MLYRPSQRIYAGCAVWENIRVLLQHDKMILYKPQIARNLAHVIIQRIGLPGFAQKYSKKSLKIVIVLFHSPASWLYMNHKEQHNKSPVMRRI